MNFLSLKLKKKSFPNKTNKIFISIHFQEQTMELMYCDPEPDDDGEVRENLEFGGRRRIDRIVFDGSCKNKPVGYRFITSFAGMTDHVPVALSIQTDV